MSKELVNKDTGEILAPVPQQGNPLDLPSTVLKESLDRRLTNRKMLIDWVRTALVDGIDYGRLHFVSKSKCQQFAQSGKCDNTGHYSKPSLFKPGAEKINGMLGTTATFPTLPEYERAVLAGAELKQIILRCALLDPTGSIVAEGVGARSLAQDYGDLNKALKMAEKSAYIDATLRMAGLSEIFTQDIEDMTIPPAGEKLNPKLSDDPGSHAAQTTLDGVRKRELEAKIKAASFATEYHVRFREGVKAWMRKNQQKNHFTELSLDEWRTLIDRLPKLAEVFFKQIADNPIPPSEQEKITDRIEKSVLTMEEFLDGFGIERLDQITMIMLDEAWQVLGSLAKDKAEKTYANATPEEKRRAERQFMEREEKGGRNPTKGT